MSNTAQDKAPVGEPYWDKYGIPRVSLAKALAHVERHIKHGMTRGVICLISEAGEGKSQGIRQLARKYGRRIVDIRTSQFSLIGAGVPQRAEGDFFKIAVPDDMPRPGEKCILLFDEINQGQQHALAMFFKFLEDRGIFNYELPDDCIVIALMNPSTAGYNVSRIETNAAINRRLKKFYTYNTFADWKKHAQTKHFHDSDPLLKGRPCHPMVVKFLTTSPNLLYAAKDRDANKSFACPATWQTVSADLYLLEMDNISICGEEAEEMVSATINTVMARSLIDYIRNNEILISPEEVLAKYKPKSKLRERILEMRDQPGGDYLHLVEVLADHVFSTRPPPEEIAPRLALFWTDMPTDAANSFYDLCGNAAKRYGEREGVMYMMKLTEELQTQPGWNSINSAIISAHDNYQKQLLGQDSNPDPLED